MESKLRKEMDTLMKNQTVIQGNERTSQVIIKVGASSKDRNKQKNKVQGCRTGLKWQYAQTQIKKKTLVNTTQTSNNSGTYSKDKNLRIHTGEERAEMNSKYTHGLFNEIIAEISPHLEKTKRLSTLKSHQTTSRHDQRSLYSNL